MQRAFGSLKITASEETNSLEKAISVYAVCEN